MPRLDSIADIRMGATLRGRDATRPAPYGTYAFLRIGDISQSGTISPEDVISINPKESFSESLVLKPGDVLFPNRGNRTTAFTFTGLDKPTIVGSQFFILRTDNRSVWPDYLSWYLRSETAHQHFEERRKGSYVQIIQRKDLGELEMPLPSLADQHKIVEIARLAQQERSLSDQLTALRWKLTNQQLLKAATKLSE